MGHNYPQSGVGRDRGTGLVDRRRTSKEVGEPKGDEKTTPPFPQRDVTSLRPNSRRRESVEEPQVPGFDPLGNLWFF